MRQNDDLFSVSLIPIPDEDIGHFEPKPMIFVMPAQAGIQENLSNELDARLRGHDGYLRLHRNFHAEMENQVSSFPCEREFRRIKDLDSDDKRNDDLFNGSLDYVST